MAEPESAPQAFTWGPFQLKGRTVSFSDDSAQRFVEHKFLKRDGGRTEDMGREVFRLVAEVVFVGTDCAKKYAEFKAGVHEQRTRLLVHPIAGRWQAFCEGVKGEVRFANATDEIRARVAWHENQLDTKVAKDVPDVATAAQNATGQLTKFQQGVASYLCALAKARALVGSAIAAINTLAEQIALVDDPIDLVSESLSGIVGAASGVIGSVLLIETKAQQLVVDVTNFIEKSTDLYNGGSIVAATADQAETLLGVVVASAEDLQATLLSTAASPAGAGDAFAEAEELAAACYELKAAVDAEKPPVVPYTTRQLTDAVTIAAELYPDDDPIVRSEEIRALNRIPNPMLIPAGTRLRVYSR